MAAEKLTGGESYVYKAKLAEQAERFDEMAEEMKELVNACIPSERETLNVEERNLLSVAYKNAVGSRRASWRVITSIEQKESSKPNAKFAALAAEYRAKVEEELNKICHEILQILADKLIIHTTEVESLVFYYKMTGDYYRYISEISSGSERLNASKDAEESYRQATETAAGLPSTHPIRLGLALNYSVFYYEIMNKPFEACEMARKAFDDAIAEFDNVSDDSYKDSTLIMQLLRDNLTLWTSDVQENEAADNAERASGGEQ